MAEPNGRAALSRRGFIMGAASAGALSAIGGLLGCAPKEQAPAQAGAQAADGADPGSGRLARPGARHSRKRHRKDAGDGSAGGGRRHVRPFRGRPRRPRTARRPWSPRSPRAAACAWASAPWDRACRKRRAWSWTSRPSSGSCCTTPTTTPRRACCKRGPTTRARRWTGGRTAVPRRTSLCGSSPAARSLARTTGICRRAIRPSSP